MRTTLNLEPDILNTVRKLASAREQSLGQVVSDLVRRGLEAPSPTPRQTSSGFPIFKVPPGSPPLTIDDIRRDDDEG
ncbi:antitoxin [Oleomonas cavernae]|uniref:antitoxin n=1 Tax=Oleomonas cavernae TaxID=2320859 RepID=UPI0011C35C8C|nr:antitoxin [Oleomonas cavernae]